MQVLETISVQSHTYIQISTTSKSKYRDSRYIYFSRVFPIKVVFMEEESFQTESYLETTEQELHALIYFIEVKKSYQYEINPRHYCLIPYPIKAVY